MITHNCDICQAPIRNEFDAVQMIVASVNPKMPSVNKIPQKGFTVTKWHYGRELELCGDCGYIITEALESAILRGQKELSALKVLMQNLGDKQ